MKHSAAASVREMITVSAKASDPSTQSVGDQLADTLVAQSLDLPPKAARVGPLYWYVNQSSDGWRATVLMRLDCFGSGVRASGQKQSIQD